MRIAIYHNLPSGGAKRSLFEEARRLSRRHTLSVYSLSSADHQFADLRPYSGEYQIFEFSATPLLKSPLGRLNQAIRLLDLIKLRNVTQEIARAIDSRGYDVLLAHPCQYEQAPSVIRFVEQVPVVYYCHEPLRLLYEPMPARPYNQDALKHRKVLNRIDPLPGLYRRSLGKNDYQNTRKANKVLVNSKFTSKAVENIYGLKAQVSYHGVDTELFHPLNVQKKNFVFSVGSLTPLKGFDFLILSLAEIPENRRPSLVIASNFQNPEERSFLEILASELKVELQLLSNINDQQLVELYNQARITLYAPVREPFGLVPLESMACATPVVAVDEGGIKETIIDGKNGLLSQRNTTNFASLIDRILVDETLADALGKRGKEHVLEHWTWDRSINELETQLSNVMNTGRYPA